MATTSLPLFPLASPALFPHCAAPLHVFERRYRALTEDALAGARLIGMATVRPEALKDLPGDPPLFAIGCAGFIAGHQRLADGRYWVLLQATSRFQIVREPPRPAGQLYRVANVTPLAEEAGDGQLAARQRSAVLRDLLAIRAAEGTAGDLDVARLESLDDVRFSCELAQALRLPGAEKQALLEARTAAERIDGIAQTLAFHRALTSSPRGGGPTLH